MIGAVFLGAWLAVSAMVWWGTLRELGPHARPADRAITPILFALGWLPGLVVGALIGAVSVAWLLFTAAFGRSAWDALPRV